MRSAADVLASVEFPDQKTLLPELNRLMQAFTALEAESWDAITKPKAARRPALGQEFMDNTAALLDVLEKTSTRIAAGRGTGHRHPGNFTQHPACRAMHQERLGEYHGRQNRRGCRRSGGGECEARLRDA
jgi:hypothetical protein